VTALRWTDGTVAEDAEGALAAQQVIDRMSEMCTTPDSVWLAFIEVAVKFGWKSPACRAFVYELAKRTAR
jgi:hypothetical protein